MMIRKFLDKTFLRFLAVGVANTLFGSGIMFLFYNVFHFGYWISSASNYILGSILSYFLNKHFTFRNTEKGARVFLRFAANIAVCYALAYGIAKPLARLILSGFSVSWQENAAMLVGMCAFTLLNYIGQRIFAFKADEK